MSRADFFLAEGDELPVIRSNLTWGDGAAVDLTGAAVVLQIRPENRALPVTAVDATIVGDPILGMVEYNWQPADTETPGNFDARWVVVFQDGRQASFPNNRKLLISIDTPINDDGGGGSTGIIPFVPSVADVAELSAVTSTRHGQTYRVRTLRSLFYLDPTSTISPVANSIVTAISGGRWFRMGPGDLFWQVQQAWFYDDVAGNDEASGLDVSHPIKSITELWRRTSGATVLTDVTLNVAGGILSNSEGAIFDLLASGPRQWILA